MSENTYRHRKDAIDFDEIKSQRSMLDTKLIVKRERIHRCPEDRLKVEKEITELYAKISELDALLAKAPPLPALPPSQPLVKVSGVLEELNTLFTKGYFTDREYEPDEFTRQESQRQWGSVLLAAIGESAAATVNAQDSVRESHTYDFVQGKINGKPFYGWLGYCSAQCGDDVDMAATDHGDHYEVYALALPELRVITTIPCCAYGVIGKANAAAIGGIPF
ncbi:putative type VI secretion system effector, partial [Cronobacter sakazakii]